MHNIGRTTKNNRQAAGKQLLSDQPKTDNTALGHTTLDSARQISHDIATFVGKLFSNDKLTDIEFAQIARIFRDTSPLGPLLGLLFLLAGLVLWNHVPRVWLILFIVGFIADLISKLIIVSRFKRANVVAQRSASWRRAIFFGVMLTSSLWGASTLFLLYDIPTRNLVVAIGVFALVVFIAITLARNYLPVQTIGACCTFLPMCIALLFSGIWQYQLLSVLMIFSLMMLLSLFRSSAEAAHYRLAEKARRDERHAIMRELHDGMGGHLMSALALAEQQQEPEKIQNALRSALGGMRLLIDASDDASISLGETLGFVRQTIEPLLNNAGLVLHWQVAITPTATKLNPTTRTHLMRILQECITNVIKHASASAVTIRTVNHPGHCEIELIDNGCGIDRSAGDGHGLDNISYRCRQIGASMEISGSDNGTRVSIALPVQSK